MPSGPLDVTQEHIKVWRLESHQDYSAVWPQSINSSGAAASTQRLLLLPALLCCPGLTVRHWGLAASLKPSPLPLRGADTGWVGGRRIRKMKRRDAGTSQPSTRVDILDRHAASLPDSQAQETLVARAVPTTQTTKLQRERWGDTTPP